MEQTSPIQALLQQRTLLQLEYYTEKEAFRKLTEQIGMRRKVKRGDAWFPLRIGKSFYNSLNQKSIEVFRTSDEEIDHNFEFGRPVMFFKSEERSVKSEEFNSSSVIYTTHKRNREQSYLEQQALAVCCFFVSLIGKVYSLSLRHLGFEGTPSGASPKRSSRDASLCLPRKDDGERMRGRSVQEV